jgi:two-component system chemotaxis sensor kinase CheA
MSPVTVRVDWLQVEKISQIATDLLVLGKQLAAHTQDHLSDERFISFVSLLDKKVNLIFATSLRLKKISLSSLFLKSQRMIRDLSLHLGKPVHFTYSGEMLEVDRLVAEVLSETLIHILRNALDHGIESEEVRMQLGKPKKGLIQLSASQTQQEVIIQISDDGAGLSREKILGRAIQDGLLSNETGGVHSDRLSDSEVFELILAPGFSTAEKVTDVSGRGVGLDVVKTNLNQLRATLKIETQLGAGTRFTITLPLGAAKPYSSESKAA